MIIFINLYTDCILNDGAMRLCTCMPTWIRMISCMLVPTTKTLQHLSHSTGCSTDMYVDKPLTTQLLPKHKIAKNLTHCCCLPNDSWLTYFPILSIVSRDCILMCCNLEEVFTGLNTNALWFANSSQRAVGHSVHSIRNNISKQVPRPNLISRLEILESNRTSLVIGPGHPPAWPTS